MSSSRALTSWTFPSVIWIKVGIEPRRSRSVWSLMAACVFETVPTGKEKDTDRSWSSRRRRRFDPIRRRKGRRNTETGLCESTLGQSRPKCASRGFRWHGPDCCGKLLRGFPYDKVCCAWPKDRLRYRAGFPGNSTGRRPTPETDRGKRMILLCNCRHRAGRIFEMPGVADAPSLGRK